MSRTYRSWARDYNTKKFNSHGTSRTWKSRKIFTRNELIRLWNGKSKGRYNY